MPPRQPSIHPTTPLLCLACALIAGLCALPPSSHANPDEESAARTSDVPAEAAATAPADDPDEFSRREVGAQALDMSGSVGDARDRTGDDVSSSSGGSVTGVLDFISADSFLGGEALDVTDAALFRVKAMRDLGRVRIGMGIDLLAKQPPGADELLWQGVSVGGQLRLTKNWAVGLATAAGPMLDKLGWHTASEAHALARKNLDDHLFMTATAGTLATVLFPDAGGRKPWLVEGLVRGEVVLRQREMAAAWVGSTYAVPVAHSKSAEAIPGAGTMDPQIRLSLHGGFTLSWVENWDLFVDAALIDRGEASAPDTQLPIFDGGFDQSRLVFGITYRFDEEESGEPVLMAI